MEVHGPATRQIAVMRLSGLRGKDCTLPWTTASLEVIYGGYEEAVVQGFAAKIAAQELR